MMYGRKTLVYSIAPALLLSAALPALAQQAPTEGPVPTTATITVEAKHNAQFDPQSLRLQINRHDTPITSVTSISKVPTQVAVLIDDGLRMSFANQLDDMRKFLLGLPNGVQVLVGYMQEGTVREVTRGFTADHQAAADSLRLPFAARGISASPYFCLSDFVKQWPSNEPGARIVLMITNGVDPYNGSTSPMNQDSPYVQQAQEDAQAASVAVYSLYYSNAGMRFGAFSGQSYLSQVAEATGAMSFNQGTITPPSILPYLNEFTKALSESYIVAFQALPAKKNTLDGLKVMTSQRDVKIHAPEAVKPGVSLLR